MFKLACLCSVVIVLTANRKVPGLYILHLCDFFCKGLAQIKHRDALFLRHSAGPEHLAAKSVVARTSAQTVVGREGEVQQRL